MPQHIADLPINAISISAVDGVNVSEGQQRNLVNNAQRAAMAMTKAAFASSANTITASAGLFNLASISTGDYVLMAPPSGGSITSFGAASDGLQKYLESTGTVLLRDGASLSVQGGADLTIVAGDVVWCRRDQGIWKAKIWRGDGSPVTSNITSTAAGTLLTITSTDAGASSGPDVVLDRNSATPAASDSIGRFIMRGRDSGGNSTNYVDVQGAIVDTTDTSEDGTLYVGTMAAGSLSYWQFLSGGLLHLSAGGGNKGVGTVNATGLYVAGHGTVAQVVRDSEATYTTCSTDLPVDNTVPTSSEGDEVLSVAITPVNASSMIVVRFTGMVGASGGGNGGVAAFNNTTAIDARAFEIRVSTSLVPVALEVAESAGSTSARTYSVRVGPAVGGPASIFLNGDASSRIFGGTAKASLEVYEILPQ